MGAVSRGHFVRKWVWRNGASQLGRADEVAMLADLDGLIAYSGGNIETAKVPVAGEDVNPGIVQDEEERRRAL